MEVLVCLAHSAGEPLTKDDLLRAVWKDTFVSDDVLSRSISELRRVFEDDARQPQFIQTIPKRGYRLLAPVTPLNGKPVADDAATQLPEMDARRKTRRRWFWSVTVVLGGTGLVLLFALNAGGFHGRLHLDSTPPIHSLAVLPLQNLSGDPTQEYFSDGMTEELITELSRLNAVTVISRTSVMRYKKSDKSLPEIARELNVDAILEGSVLRSGDRVRITAQLISAKTDANVWAETYDRNLQDTLAVQEAVAAAIAGKIRAGITSTGTMASKTGHPVNFKAHEAYLRGLEEYGLGGGASNHRGMQAVAEQHFRQASEYFEQSIREDPQYAPVYVALAGASASASDQPQEAEAYALKALKYDDNLSDAHLVIGAIRLVCDRNWGDAEREILRAIELNPSSAAAHQEYGFFLDTAGRLDDGMKEFQRAQELDPAGDHLSGALYSRREFDKVIETGRMALSNNPEQYTSQVAIIHKMLMVAYARTGKQKESIEEMRAALTSMGYRNLAEDLRRGYSRGGYEGALQAWLRKRDPSFPFKWVDTYAYTELGDYDQAFARLPKTDPSDWGNTAYSDANAGNYGDSLLTPTLVTLRTEPMWDPLHSDPRFDQLVRSLGFPQ
jgi:TolB-like protein/tetratricopeptide (TPR) repeat protein